MPLSNNFHSWKPIYWSRRQKNDGVFMASTKRAQNKCKKCGYTWYPRGKHVSLKCPDCGSTEVGFAGGGWGLIALLVIGIAIFGGKKESHDRPSVAIPSSQPSDALTASSSETSSVPPPSLVEKRSLPAEAQIEAPQVIENSEGKNLQIQPCGVKGLPEQCGEGSCESQVNAEKCKTEQPPKNELF